MLNFVVLGTSELTLCLAKNVIKNGCRIVALVSMPKEHRPNNSVGIADFAAKQSIPYFEFEDINSPESKKIITEIAPDFILSSWPKMIDKSIISIPKRMVIGSHPAALPYNRGRHPLHWHIALGIKDTFISFFNMDEGVDSGNILIQEPFSIEESDNINDANNKMVDAASFGLRKLIEILKKDHSYAGKTQDQTKASVWRKRDAFDVMIDFRMSIRMIKRLIRSFSYPYPCAKLIYKTDSIKISSFGSIKYNDENTIRLMHGEILKIIDRSLFIKADDGVIELISLYDLPDSIKEAKFISPPGKYLMEYKEELMNKINK